MREVLGLGGATKVDWIEIKWPQPSGRVERITDVPIDRYVTIVEGKGTRRMTQWRLILHRRGPASPPSPVSSSSPSRPSPTSCC